MFSAGRTAGVLVCVVQTLYARSHSPLTTPRDSDDEDHEAADWEEDEDEEEEEEEEEEDTRDPCVFQTPRGVIYGYWSRAPLG